jgi:hypothetical protein
MARLFDIVVFTASQQIYAEQLLDIVDPKGEYISHRIYRDSCVVWEGNYLKDLTVLGRDLAHTIIVDNSPQAFGFQLENGVPIESWYDDDNDVELLRLIPFLEQLAKVEDVRPHLGDKFVAAKLKYSQKWYNWKTAVSVLQGTGRSVRTPDDWAVTYLIDGCFGDLFQAAGDQFPIEFRSRVKIERK